MLGLELLTVPAMMATQIAFSQCDHKPVPKISTRIYAKDPMYDTTKTHKDLEQFKIDTVSPYEAGVHSKVSGLMSGNINVTMSANIAWSTHPITKNSCMWFDEIEVKILSEPTIYIAREHNDHRCRYNATLRHELKHIAVDEAVMRKYKPRFDNAVHKTVRNLDLSKPFPAANVEQQRAVLNKHIQKAIEATLEDMKAERRVRQQKIDSRHEYDHLSRLCGGR